MVSQREYLGAAVWIGMALGVHAMSEPFSREYPTKSGIKPWVDPATPEERQTYTSSRGRVWELVMSDEFDQPDRDFRPGADHLWTSLEKPDGVNGALETYTHNLTSTACDDDGTCYFYIKTIDKEQTIRVFNQYLNPPAFTNASFHYRSAMVQSWNKFCFQGGMLEARVQLPGAVSPDSGNPDLAKGPTGVASSTEYYPTWPGIWTMGNLGRAIFSASTNRMWPFSYSECEPDVFAPRNQRISACEKNPKYGLNPGQGRGAPEIDLLEGAGSLISSSLQIAPGMPPDFRLVKPDPKIDKDFTSCMYTGVCKTPGANFINVPASLYKKRGHPSWYRGLRYAANPFCRPDGKLRQNYETVLNSVKRGVEDNTCTVATCPGSQDVNSDLGFIDGVGPDRWGINTNGTCFPLINAYAGSYLCDPDNQERLCPQPRNDSTPPTNIMKPFNYQMDALSANWPVHVGAYTDYLVYQFEWVTGKNGYVRWMLNGHPIYEVTAESIMNVPQDGSQSNPRKMMIEEPMYVIFNVAVSASWGARPPNVGKPCRGDGSDPTVNRICDAFPMMMKIDYIRIYQDQGDDRDEDNLMAVGCDPASHPTREWIAGHLDEYEDYQNPIREVAGRAFCRTDDDCTVAPTGGFQFTRLVTGTCVKNRCVCKNGESWGGPRCAMARAEITTTKNGSQIYGPPMVVALGVAAIAFVLTVGSIWVAVRKERGQIEELQAKKAAAMGKESHRMSVAMSPMNDLQDGALRGRLSVV